MVFYPKTNLMFHPVEIINLKYRKYADSRPLEYRRKLRGYRVYCKEVQLNGEAFISSIYYKDLEEYFCEIYNMLCLIICQLFEEKLAAIRKVALVYDGEKMLNTIHENCGINFKIEDDLLFNCDKSYLLHFILDESHIPCLDGSNCSLHHPHTLAI